MHSIARKGVETFVTRAVTQLLSISVGIMVARQLGPDAKGIFAFATTALGVLLTVAAGQSAAISWQYGRLHLASGAVWDATRRFFFRIMLPGALVTGLVGFLLHKQYALLATAAAVPAFFFLQMSASFTLAEGKVRVSNTQSFLVSSLFALTIAFELYAFHVKSVGAVLIAWVACPSIVCIYAARRLEAYARERLDGASLVRQQLEFGAKVTSTALVSYLNFNIDLFIVLALLGPTALGVYTVAIGFGQLMWQLTSPLAFSAFGTVVSGEHDRAARLTAKCVRHGVLWMAPIALLIAVWGPEIVRFVYGPRFEYAGTVARYLIPGMVAYSAMPFFATYFSQQLSRPLVMAFTNGVSTVICAGASAALIPYIGIAGGAIATSISYSVASIIALIYFTRESGISLTKIFSFDAGDWTPYVDLVRTSTARLRS